MLKPVTGILCSLAISYGIAAADAPRPPNILLILTDDQGWGDLGCHGNPHLKTPHIDRLAKEGIDLTRFYVSPVCAPTRASLMTGRYNYRTGVTDTWFGRANMAAEEFTIAEALNRAGYATGLFGKWHLGDTYPYRPEDQGFDEVLRHRGGGIGQPSDPPGSSYFAPLLFHNGIMKKYSGYCMDVYTDAAIRFIKANKNKPFFAYLATNTPHSPLQVSDKYADPYRKLGLSEETSKIYGMIANIDDNVGRLMAELDEMNLVENTLVIFMSDNGPKISSKDRHTASLRGQKTDVLEGGIRVPFFIRWPMRLDAGRKIDRIAAHIDLMPTLLDACNVPAPEPVAFDGISLLPLMESTQEPGPERTLFFQWHRGNSPSEYRNVAIVQQGYKLIQNSTQRNPDLPLSFQLYKLTSDPGETTDLSNAHPEKMKTLKDDYRQWFSTVCKTRGFKPSPAWVGTEHENPVILTQQDRRDAEKWGNDHYYPAAYWPIRAIKSAPYTVTLTLYNPAESGATAVLQLGERQIKEPVRQTGSTFRFSPAHLAEGDYRISAWIESNGQKHSPQFLEIKQ
jgi:arylsulfatase A-like enzyme